MSDVIPFSREAREVEDRRKALERDILFLNLSDEIKTLLTRFLNQEDGIQFSQIRAIDLPKSEHIRVLINNIVANIAQQKKIKKEISPEKKRIYVELTEKIMSFNPQIKGSKNLPPELRNALIGTLEEKFSTDEVRNRLQIFYPETLGISNREDLIKRLNELIDEIEEFHKIS